MNELNPFFPTVPPSKYKPYIEHTASANSTRKFAAFYPRNFPPFCNMWPNGMPPRDRDCQPPSPSPFPTNKGRATSQTVEVNLIVCLRPLATLCGVRLMIILQLIRCWLVNRPIIRGLLLFHSLPSKQPLRTAGPFRRSCLGPKRHNWKKTSKRRFDLYHLLLVHMKQN